MEKLLKTTILIPLLGIFAFGTIWLVVRLESLDGGLAIVNLLVLSACGIKWCLSENRTKPTPYFGWEWTCIGLLLAVFLDWAFPITWNMNWHIICLTVGGLIDLIQHRKRSKKEDTLNFKS